MQGKTIVHYIWSRIVSELLTTFMDAGRPKSERALMDPVDCLSDEQSGASV